MDTHTALLDPHGVIIASTCMRLSGGASCLELTRLTNDLSQIHDILVYHAAQDLDLADCCNGEALIRVHANLLQSNLSHARTDESLSAALQTLLCKDYIAAPEASAYKCRSLFYCSASA